MMTLDLKESKQTQSSLNSASTVYGAINDSLHYYQRYFDFWSCGKLLYLMLTKKHLNVDFQECLHLNDVAKGQISELEFCSDLVKDLLYKLLSFNTFKSELLTMDKVLLHPWFNLAKNTSVFNCHVHPHDELERAISLMEFSPIVKVV